jgi:hypothetical protein
MTRNIAQRRAAKAVRRKALVREKRMAEMGRQGKNADEGYWAPLPVPRTHKASAALIDIAEHLTGEEDDRDTRHKTLILAMVAWNLSLLPAAERKEQMRSFFEGFAGIGDETDQSFKSSDGEAFACFEEIMRDLISRKLLLYPLDRRWLLDLEVFETSDGFRVNVTSALDKAA